MTTVKEILIEVLKDMGADGLCEGECGCGIDDLMPCETAPIWCVPAKKDTPPEDEDCDEWYRPMTDEEINEFAAKKLDHDMHIPEGESTHYHTISRI